jgi:hypothetical protein
LPYRTFAPGVRPVRRQWSIPGPARKDSCKNDSDTWS